IGGSLIPGAAFLEEIGFANPTSLSHLGSPVRGALAVPITLLPDPAPNAPATTVDELAQSGQFTPPLVGAGNVMSATLSRSVDQKMGYPQPIDQRGEFSRRDGQAALILTWYPKEKRKGIPAVRLYDLDNRVISESKGKGITLKPNKLFYSTWQLNLGGLPPGVYRLDILLDADPVWRIFFRMVE
ncbi:MAG TPA: hypothetical protein VNO70_06755, partial [Blastocatellia bacterium]|nr:hypothetical protein [Blastocatellia bacterium]